MMTILINIFKFHLRVVYFFLKFLKTDNSKILLLSRQSDSKSIDFELIENDIKKRYSNKSKTSR